MSGEKIELGPVRRKWMMAPSVWFVDGRVVIHDSNGADVRLNRAESVNLMLELQQRFPIDALASAIKRTTHSTGAGPDPEYTAREDLDDLDV